LEVGAIARFEAADALHPATAQEATLSQGLHNAFGYHIAVRCITPAAMRERQTISLESAGKVHGLTVPYIPLSWLLQSECDSISALAADPPQQASQIDSVQIAALHDLVHEASHAEGQLSESGAQCEAIQGVAKLAVALGAPPNLNSDITHTDTLVQLEWQVGMSADGTILPLDYDLQNCYQGGPYDMRWLTVGADYPQAPPTNPVMQQTLY